MSEETQTVPVSKARRWTGYVMTALPAVLLLFSGVMKLLKPEQVIEGFTELGYDESLALGIGITEIGCTLVYLYPRTAVLGAILLTGYLGGATATHVRVGDPFIMPIVVGVVVWGGVFLRDERLRELLPLRK